MKKIEVYQCSFCSTYRKTKASMKKHEERCFYNPKNKVCGSCLHNIRKTGITEENVSGQKIKFLYKYRYCDAENIELTQKTMKREPCINWELKK